MTRDKQYRESFVDNEIAVGVPFQIRAMRENLGWTQCELGNRTDKRQSVISQLENPGYGKLTLSTLKTLAAAFDVGLMVRFVTFSELISRAANLSEEDVAVPNFSEDKGLLPTIDKHTSDYVDVIIDASAGYPISLAQEDSAFYYITHLDEVQDGSHYRTNTRPEGYSGWSGGDTHDLLQQRRNESLPLGFPPDVWRGARSD